MIWTSGSMAFPLPLHCRLVGFIVSLTSPFVYLLDHTLFSSFLCRKRGYINMHLLQVVQIPN